MWRRSKILIVVYNSDTLCEWKPLDDGTSAQIEWRCLKTEIIAQHICDLFHSLSLQFGGLEHYTGDENKHQVDEYDL